MKRLLAIVLTGCLMLQPLPGSVLAAQESELSAETEMVLSSEDAADQGETIPETTEAVVETPETELVSTEAPAEEIPGEEISSETGEAQEEPVTGELTSEEPGSEEPASGDLPEETTEETAGEGTAEDELILGDTIEAEPELESEPEFDFSGGIMLLSADSWADKSFLEVKVVCTLPFLYQREVTVSLENGPMPVLPRTLVIPDGNNAGASTKFSVVPGEYTVRIHAEKFADFVQTVSVEEHSTSKIEVCTSQTAKSETTGTRGWLRLGDVSGDGQIDATDLQLIMTCMRSGMSDATCNLNDSIDNIVDLADLQYAVRSLGESQEASVEKLAVPQGLVPNETLVTGAENILNDEGTTTLAPMNAGEISDENPVAVDFMFTAETDETVVPPMESLPKMEGMTIQAPMVEDEAAGTYTSNIAGGTAEVEYVYLDGGTEKTGTMTISLAAAASAAVPMMIDTLVQGSATVEPDGSLVLNFGGQIAVKRVTLKITGTKKKEALVDIAKVEFVNDMESRIPAPQMNIPVVYEPAVGNEEITVSWEEQANVTGYEVYVSGPTKKSGGAAREQIVRVSGTPHTIVSICDESLDNFETYTIKVRSVNGEWTSPWSVPVTAVPEPNGRPDPVDNLVTEGGFRSIRASWKDMDDANGYMLYYREKDTGDYQPVVAGYTKPADGTDRLMGNNYTITGLKDGTTYEVYVIGWNKRGWGEPSIVSIAGTDSGDTPKLPMYRLINTSNGVGELTAHIVSAVCGNHNGQKMVDSPRDEAKGDTRPTVSGQMREHARWAEGVVDDDYTSYWIKTDWDDGVSYPVNDFSKGVTITFDNEYKMNYLTFTAADIQASPERARIMYWNEQTGNEGAYVGSTLIREIDETNRPFFIVKFDNAVTASQIQMCIGTGYSKIDLKIAEMHFHSYDQLDDDIMALFADEMHSCLKENVTQDMIDALRVRLNTRDEATGELHPLYKSLELELKAAEELLKWNAGETIAIDNRITAAKDGHINFGGLNAWQPLGRVAAAGDKLIIYVGHNTRSIGERSDLKLYFTQYHAEANTLSNYYSLKVGRNEITLQQVSGNNFERGGQLYIAYEGNNSNDRYGVRVNGGAKIPVLNVYKKTGQERTDAIRQYLAELEEYQAAVAEKHVELHAGSDNKNVNGYAYDSQNCFLNATDVVMDYMMYSFPATQVWNSISSQGGDSVTILDNALKAMDQTMVLFYQHKGLNSSNSGKGGRNLMPSCHLNIRYMRMFSGAFMYASGNHIGVEWGQTNLCGAASWNSFGWGIAHEIGHDINDPAYAIAEITNNYFAQLLTIDYSGVRWGDDYEAVYKKVTSGATGRSANVGTQLALYWQLHLAFDDYADKTIFDDYDTQFNNLFFARVDTYSRNPGLAKKNEVELKLDGGVDQNLMRLACAAAQQNILPFFERWGMVPDADTAAYAKLYGEPTRKALYYVNDDARDYRAAHKGEDTGSFAANVTASVEAKANQATLSMRSGADKDLLLGFEITRGMISNGELKQEVIGFAPAKDGAAVYHDTIAAMDNRVMYYEVRAVDKFLNYSAPVDAGSVKISTAGALGKDLWTVETTMTSADDTEIKWDAENPDGGYDAQSGTAARKSSIDRIIDNDWDNQYTGVSNGNEKIIIDLQKTLGVTSVRYMGSDLESVSIAVSTDGNNWTAVKDNYAVKNCSTSFTTIWFDSVHESEKDKWIGTYDARYVRFIIPQSGTIAISEIDVCGPSGDNVEFYGAGSTIPAIGVTANDYQYGTEAEDVIPEGSLIFAGTYKGNPAYNVVVLYDQDGNVIGAKDDKVDAVQVIFAEVPEKGNLGETSDGAWVYFVKPGDWDETSISGITGVRAELFRVDNAHTLEGERIVSDTEMVKMPASLPRITLTDDVKNQQ